MKRNAPTGTTCRLFKNNQTCHGIDASDKEMYI